jgi:HAD superfamily phosphoserine phosphatase-like hydrolase
MEIHCWKRRAEAGNQERGAGGDVKERKEANEVKEVIAAFFDLDGTLVAPPSLESRLFRTLRYRREIRAKNYLFWLREALRLMPRGINAILHANKMYLRGLKSFDERGEGDGDVSSWHTDGHQAEGQASAPPRRTPRLPVPTFFAQAIETVAWHAKQGHEIVLISGTLEPLARGAARAMEAELAARGIAVAARVIATRLEEKDGKITGKILDEAMFGEAKARAAKRLAGEMRLDLGRCYAYGDSLNDRSLMVLVGQPAAVNPSSDFASIAHTHGWPVLHWEGKESSMQSGPDQTGTRPQRNHREERTADRDCVVPRLLRTKR